MEHQIIWGIGFILAGIFSIWNTIYYPVKGKDIWQDNFKGLLFGVCGLIGGFVFICDEFKNHHVQNPISWIMLFFIGSVALFVSSIILPNKISQLSKFQNNGFFITVLLFFLGLTTLVTHLASFD